jgi:general stress protein 26
MNGARDVHKHVEKLNRLVDGIRIAMLVTADADGSLHSRPMATQEIDEEGSVWFLTSASSHKIDEVRGHDRVNLAYANADDHRYVSLSGRATLVRDRARIDELWSPAHKTWFPKGKDDPDLAVLRVAVDKAEYWDTPGGTMVVLFEYARTMLTGKPFDAGHHETLDLGGT